MRQQTVDMRHKQLRPIVTTPPANARPEPEEEFAGASPLRDGVLTQGRSASPRPQTLQAMAYSPVRPSASQASQPPHPSQVTPLLMPHPRPAPSAAAARQLPSPQTASLTVGHTSTAPTGAMQAGTASGRAAPVSTSPKKAHWADASRIRENDYF